MSYWYVVVGEAVYSRRFVTVSHFGLTIDSVPFQGLDIFLRWRYMPDLIRFSSSCYRVEAVVDLHDLHIVARVSWVGSVLGTDHGRTSHYGR